MIHSTELPRRPAPVAAPARRSALVAAVVAAGLVPLAAPVAAQSTTTQISRQIQGDGEVEIVVRYSAGTARIRAADARTLYALRLVYDPEIAAPLHQYENGRAVLGIDNSRAGRVAPLLRRGRPGAEMDLTLTTRVPMSLDLELGAVEADLDLGGLRLRSLSLETGASDGTLRVSSPNPEPMTRARISVGAASFRAIGLGNLNAAEIDVDAGVGDIDLDFSGLRRNETSVSVDLGMGSLEIRIPESAGLHLTRDSFLTSFDAPGLEVRGDELFSPNWAQAERRIRMEVDAAFGTVSIVRVPD